MSQREVNAIAGRLSLRAPQTESLVRLAQAIEASPFMLKHDRNSAEVAEGAEGVARAVRHVARL
jgi:type III restriction enzyme